MSFYYGLSTYSTSSIFNNSFRSSNKSSNISYLNDLYSNLGDYGTLRSGTYSKLLKSYYEKTRASSSTNSSTSSEATTTEQIIATDASALKNDADALSTAKYTEDNRTKLTESIKNFTDSYNDLVKSIDSSSNHAVAQKYKSLTNLTSKHSSLLSSVGISVNTDNTLTINEDTLSKSNLSTLKSAFSGRYSYSNQVSYYANLIYSANSNGVDSTYTKSGTISTLPTSSILDTFA